MTDLSELKAAAEARLKAFGYVHNHKSMIDDGSYIPTDTAIAELQDQIHTKNLAFSEDEVSSILSLIARVERLEAENARLRALLRPFAEEAKTLWDIGDDQRLVYPGAMNIGTGKEAISDFTVGDLRAAHATLEGKP